MKAILEFNLPEDQYDYEVNQKAENLRQALTEIDKVLHSQKKYGHEDLTQEQCDKLHHWFLGVLDDHDIGTLVRG